MADWLFAAEFIAGAIISIIVISNPVSTSAIFITLTDGMDHKEKLSIAKRSVTYAAGILVFFALTGFLLFKLFGFTIGAFRIAGGVLLFTTAVSMLDLRPAEKAAKDTSRDIALIPLAIPFTAGPGTIVTVVVLMSEGAEVMFGDHIIVGILCLLGVFLGIAVTIAVSYVMMSKSEFIDARLKEGGRRIVSKIMGLLVMAIAIQFIINGIKDLLPEFVRIVQDSAGVLVG